jgi:UDP-glucuronate 4-epimerase
MKQIILVTRAAGFIGYHLVKKIYKKFNNKALIVGVDNINNYYSPKLKLERINDLKKNIKNFFLKNWISFYCKKFRQ